MKSYIVLLVGVLCCSAFADHPPSKDDQSAVLLDGLGNHHHSVSTKNPEAQKFFDQGLRLLYAFNHDEAHRAFQRAAELDPRLAMTHWGMALAVGPNYNADAMEAQLKDAYRSIQKARELANNAPEPERDYIDALAKRYAADPKTADKKKLALAYKEAMEAVAKKYPDDLDAATLAAESAMNLRPWDLWTQDGKPAEGTVEILAALEGVLRRNPHHMGACHYYIHAAEASPYPERAWAVADRLETLAPAAGHLVHMPSHIYIRVGDFVGAVRANEKAAAADRAYFQKRKVQGIYPMMYYSHNLHFLAVAHAMQGRFTDAKKAADQLVAHVGPHVKDMPMLEAFLPTPTLLQVRFHRWEDILSAPAPEANLTITRALWHFARGLAFAAQDEIKQAEAELAALQKITRAMPENLQYGNRNLAKKVLTVPLSMLQANLDLARKDPRSAIENLQKAIEVEDSLNYIEPADWYIPSREALGALYLRTGNPSLAEKAFRADLEKNRRNPRSLFGLRESLKAQGNLTASRLVDQEFQAVWRNAEVRELKLEDL
jgi:tetratricopeptide (TPR) repeat protein